MRTDEFGQVWYTAEEITEKSREDLAAEVTDRIRQLSPDQCLAVLRFLDQLPDRIKNQTDEPAPALKESAPG